MIVAYSLPDTNAGIGLYNSNSNFGDATTIVDFVQYESGGKENVAVEAGIWSAVILLPLVDYLVIVLHMMVN